MTTEYISPPKYAKDLGVDPSKVLTWIRSEELGAINVATNLNGRPQYRISLDAILEFETRRSATARQPAKSVTRRRKKTAADFVEYF